jgi:D-glycero-alpha-D-manno-heptose-7-phosphate kinase
LVGGGTDVDPFAAVHGGRVLNFAIDLFHTTTLVPLPNPEIKIEALEEERTFALTEKPLTYGTDQKFDLLRAVINHFLPNIPSGFSLRLSGPKINPLGLGRSGSAAVSVIGAFDAWLGTNMSRMEIGLLVSHLETEELGWPGGKQDSLVAGFGGINVMDFGLGNHARIQPLRLPDQIILDFRRYAFMVYVGGDRHSADQQIQLIKGMSKKDNAEAMFALREAVLPAADALRRGEWSTLGHILHQGWEDKKKSNPSVSSDVIDDYYARALRCGAYGGKVCGAGGAGSMFFLIPPEKKAGAIKELTSMGAALVDFSLDFKGLKVASM